MIIKGHKCALTQLEAIEIFKTRRPFLNCKLSPKHPASLQSLAEKYGVSVTTIGDIARGKRYKELSLEQYYSKNIAIGSASES